MIKDFFILKNLKPKQLNWLRCLRALPKLKAIHMEKITQADIDAGGVKNTAVSTGKAPNKPDGTPGADVNDTSDTGTDENGGTITDPENNETSDMNGSSDGNSTNDKFTEKVTFVK